MLRLRASLMSLLARLLTAAVLAGAGNGCAALTNPTLDAVPARRLPDELLAASQCGMQTIPLQALQQPVPAEYLLAPGDVLGVYVEGFLGERNQALPLHIGPRLQTRDSRTPPASSGYPVTVDPDGTLTLPLAGKLAVAGKTVPQVRDEVLKRYLEKNLLKPDSGVVLVNLLQQRVSSVLVLRQEASSFTVGQEGTLQPASKRGTGYEVDLAGYENDVLHALTRTGGLPGLDAYNEVVIQRACFHRPADRAAVMGRLGGVRGDASPLVALPNGGEVIRIPLRYPCGQVPPIRPEDVVLRNGDVVFLEARDDQVFYTGGLLPSGIHILPRDRDLDALEAISVVRGPLFNGAFGGSNLSGALLAPGIGNPSPSQLTVLRRTPGGGQVAIRVDLRRALREPTERLVLKAGDMLLLQETPGEAMARYFSQTFFNFNLFWRVISTPDATGVLDVSGLDRLPNRIGTINLQEFQR